MKTQLLFALAAPAPCLCDSPPPSDPFHKSLVLDFYQTDHGKIGFTKESTIDDGDSPNKDNPSYLQHMKWTSASDPRRSFIWKSDTGTNVGVSLPNYPSSRDADI
jgi:hypothetical protein